MKILVIGGGSIGRRHLRNLRQLGYENLYCLKRQPDLKFEEEHACRVICIEEEVFSLKPEVIFVCSPTSLHEDGLRKACSLAAHVFMEKPLTHERFSLEKIRNEILPEMKGVFFIGFMLRYHPLVARLRELLEQEAIGKLFSARFEFGSFLPFWHPWEDHREGYAARKNLGGGVVNTITHELDLMLHLLGEPKSVFAMTANTGLLEIETEEVCEAVFRYSWGLAAIHLDFLQKDYDRRIRFLGSDGKLEWNWHENRLLLKRHGEEEQEIPLGPFDVNQLYLDELNAFFSLIRNRQAVHSLDLQYAIVNTDWMLGMHQSSEQKSIWEKS
jgi:predicted dehydrogenase